MSYMKKVVLGEVLADVLDYRGKTPTKTKHGVRLLTTRVIKDGSILSHPKAYISKETYELFMKKGMPEKGDIIFTMEAPAGEVARLMTNEPLALAQRMIAVRADSHKINPTYLYYYMQSKSFQNEVQSKATGATVLGIKKKDLLAIELRIPDIKRQIKLAEQLEKYDELIRINQLRMDILSKLARALFDFYTIGIKSFVPLSSVAYINKHRQLRKGELNDIHYVDVSSVNREYIDKIVTYDSRQAPTRAKKRVYHGDIIYSSVRPENKIWTLILDPSEKLVVSTAFSIFTCKEDIHYSFLYLAVTSDDFSQYIISRSKGATIPNATVGAFANAPIILPNRDKLTQINKKCKPILHQKYNLYKQNTELSRLRNKLVSTLIT